MQDAMEGGVTALVSPKSAQFWAITIAFGATKASKKFRILLS